MGAFRKIHFVGATTFPCAGNGAASSGRSHAPASH